MCSASLGYAVEYRFCISCDNYRGNLLVNSSTVDMGREWYRVKTSEMAAKMHNSQSCSANDYSDAECGNLPSETVEYRAINGDQIDALFSGNPVTMGQAAVEIGVGVPVEVIEGAGEVIEDIGEGAGEVVEDIGDRLGF